MPVSTFNSAAEKGMRGGGIALALSTTAGHGMVDSTRCRDHGRPCATSCFAMVVTMGMEMVAPVNVASQYTCSMRVATLVASKMGACSVGSAPTVAGTMQKNKRDKGACVSQ